MKRFTETLKWQDPWFRRLSSSAKMLWFYVLDHCDLIGLVEIDTKLVSNDCGLPIKESHIKELGNRVQDIGDGKYFITKFIPFQYGRLSESCAPHRKVIESIKRHCLESTSDGFCYPSARVTNRVTDRANNKEEDKSKEEEEDKDKVRADKSKGALDEIRSFCIEVGLTLEDADHCFYKWQGNGWTNNGKPIKDWKATIRAWTAANYMPSQKQATQATQANTSRPAPPKGSFL